MLPPLHRPRGRGGDHTQVPLLSTDPVGRDILAQPHSRLALFAPDRCRHRLISRWLCRRIVLVLAGCFGGLVDVPSMRVMDLILAFPICCWRWCW